MGLTWKDGVTTVSMGAIAAVYAAFLHGTGLWLISSARGATLAVLALGILGGCSFGSVGSLYADPQPSPAVRAWRSFIRPLEVEMMATPRPASTVGNSSLPR